MDWRRIAIMGAVLMFIPGLAGCGSSGANIEGTWNTNVAKLTLSRKGSEVTALLEGYGGDQRQELKGRVEGDTVTFDGQTPLGLTRIQIDPGGDTFHSGNPSLAFCGSRGNFLPGGCGFSGKWKLNAPDLFPDGSYAVLRQEADKVSGTIFDGNDAELMPVDAQVVWADNWSAHWRNFTATMSPDEKAFEITLDGKPASGQWCGLRDGLESAALPSFTCSVP